MRRRNFITALGSAAVAWPFAAHAQQKAMPVIGFLMPGSPPVGPNIAAVYEGLRETGFVGGKMWRSSTAGQKVTMIGYPHWLQTSSAARSM